MLTQIQVGDRVQVSDHLVPACGNPACGDPLFGTVIEARPTTFGTSYTVRLPCGSEPTYTDRFVRPA